MEVPTVKTNRALKVLCSNCKTIVRLLYPRDYQESSQYDAYHCTADQGLGALGLEFLIKTNTNADGATSWWEKKKDTNFESKFYLS